MNFVFFSTIQWGWSDGAHLPVQVAREFARRGHPVVFVQPFPSSDVDLANLPIKILALTELGLSENLVTRALHGLDVGSLQQVGDNLLAALPATLPPNQPQSAVWFSPFAPFVRLLPLLEACRYHLIYYRIDDYVDMARLGYYRHSPAAEEYLAREVDAVVAITTRTAQTIHSTAPANVIRGGVNLKEFEIERDTHSRIPPPDILCGERTLGFWGWLGDAMVDFQTLAYVARLRPRWAINLIGKWEKRLDGLSVPDCLKDFANVRILGHVEHGHLKFYGRFFDVCLIPAPDSDFSRGRDPIKVYEYLALHKPVVCTHMPQLADLPYVRNASTREAFLQEIEAALTTPVDAQLLDSFLAEQTWEKRADALLQIILGLGERDRSGAERHPPDVLSAALLAPSAAQESPALKAYLNLLETDLAQTRKWALELEAALTAKDRELKRIDHLLPIRAWRWLIRLLS